MEPSIDFKISDYLVEKAPASVYYVPDFITKQEEDFLLNKVYSAPKPKWTQLSNRRLQNWGGLPHPKGMVAEPLPTWLQVYTDKISNMNVFGTNKANHILVNEYLPGQGIMPHEDGPLFYPVVSTISLGSHTILDFYYHQDNPNSEECSVTDTIEKLTTENEGMGEKSMESSPYKKCHFTSILIEPRSLILVCDEMYKTHLHGIAERTEDELTNNIANLCSTQFSEKDIIKRGTRVSLTIRHVPKILKSKFIFGKSKR